MINSLLIVNVKTNKKFLVLNQYEGLFKKQLASGEFKQLNKYPEIQDIWDSTPNYLLFTKYCFNTQEEALIQSEDLEATILSDKIDKPKNLSQEIIGGIYCIVNIKENKYYIGCTKDFYSRYHNHKTALHKNRHMCKELQKDFNRLGKECFKFSIIEKIEDYATLLYKEAELIKNYISENKIVYNTQLIEDNRAEIINPLKLESNVKYNSKKIRVIDKDLNVVEYNSVKEAADILGFTSKRITEVLRGIKNQGNGITKKVTHYKGYRFQYCNESDFVVSNLKHIETSRVCAIYAIINIRSNKKFIRKTVDFNCSVGLHKTYFVKNKLTFHLSREIQKDYDLFGESNFKYEILEKTTPELLDTKLSEAIAKYTKDELYN